MDKRVINKFAVKARQDLILSVRLRLQALGITETGASDKDDRSTAQAEYYGNNETPLEGADINRRAKIVQRLKASAQNSDWKTAYQDLIEEVAYTWFNRIIAIRFMEINDYLPSGIRVLSSVEGRNEPDIMFYSNDVEEYIGTYTKEERELIQRATDQQLPADLDRMYQMLFIKQANALNENLPKLFERTDDYMQLLFTPSYNRGVIADLVEQIPEADFDIASDDSQGQVEIIGWLYQYYNQEPKDAAFKKKSYAQEDIPAVTQLFTPRWIVKYLVENSVGRLWINHLQAAGDQHKQLELAKSLGWDYFMPDAKQPDDVNLEVMSRNQQLSQLQPKEISVIDPSMGSGHILVYAFDVLTQIYESQGFSRREAAHAILKYNLYGADIDTRAYQLAYFSIMMKGRQLDRKMLNDENNPHVFDVPEFHWKSVEIELLTQDPQLQNNLKIINAQFSSGNELGSLIEIPLSPTDFDKLQELAKASSTGQMTLDSHRINQLKDELSKALQIIQVLSSSYRISITNPPYMGSGKMPEKLKKYTQKYYPDSKSDLFAVFMERLSNLTKSGGYYAMITQHQWMFLSSFEKLRLALSKETIINLAHLGTRAFEEIGGEVVQSAAFIIQKVRTEDFVGTYERLVDFDSQDAKENAYVKVVKQPNVNYLYRTNQANFRVIPGSPIAYWASDNLIHDFEIGTPMSKLTEPKVGLQTGDNSKFIRQWYEVAYQNIKFDARSIAESVESKRKWVPYNKGGAYRKWYGNYDYVVNWQNDGHEIRNFKDSHGKVRSRPQNTDYYFREAITWSDVNSGHFSLRLREPGSIHDVKGMSAFLTDNGEDENMYFFLLGLLNSPIGDYIFNLLNPTISLQVGNFSNFPVIQPTNCNQLVKSNVKQLLNLSKIDWNLNEIAWDFVINPFFDYIAEHNQNWTLEAAYNQWAQEALDRFNQLKTNEEELNRIFIDLYGLQDELTPEVDDKDISVRKADLPRDIKAFLSYFIGVTFGRYSLDVPGLAYAGGQWDSNKYKTYQPNQDNIILFTDDDYFGDDRDVINRLKEFLTTTFGSAHLNENLRFIADALGKKGETSEAQIRKYFIDDFYKKDHVSTYQKRPIYWQLSSGKQGGFRALMYLHRYDENTLAMIRTSYLHPLQEAYENQRVQLQKLAEDETNTKQRNQMNKRVTKLGKMIDEIAKYDVVLQHVANMHIPLDLDDGVLVNHEKVQGGQKLLSPL